MPAITWLADVLRAAGLPVSTEPGWQTRSGDAVSKFAPQGVMVHETRGSRTSSVRGEIGVLLNGSTSAEPPIAQLLLDRSGGWHVIAAGVCWHAKVGWAGPHEGRGNYQLIGIEAMHALDEPWTDVQYRSYVRGVAAICRHMGWTAARVGGHKEHQPGEKTDPGFDMARFRADVTAVLNGSQEDDMDPIDLLRLQQMHGRVEALLTGQASKTPTGQGSNVAAEPNALQAAIDGIRGAVASLTSTVAGMTNAIAASAVREQATMAALDKVLSMIAAGGGDVDVAAIKAEIGDAERRVVARLAAAQQAAADALDATDQA